MHTPVRKLIATLILGVVIPAGWVLAARTPLATEAAILQWLQPAPEADVARGIWRAASALGNGEVCIACIALALLCLRRAGWRALAAATMFLASGKMLSSLIKMMVDRARPHVVPHLEQVSSASFPSGHALNAALTYVLLACLLARMRPGRVQRRTLITGAITLALLAGVARIALGVHWPSDVLASWILAAAWLSLALTPTLRYWPAPDPVSSR